MAFARAKTLIGGRPTEAALLALAGFVVSMTFLSAAWGSAVVGDAPSMWPAATLLAVLAVVTTAVWGALLRWVPKSSQILFGLAIGMMGIGWVLAVRTDPAAAVQRSAWTAAGLLAMAAAAIGVRHLERMRGWLPWLGVAAAAVLAVPLTPAADGLLIAHDAGASSAVTRAWVQAGGMSFSVWDWAKVLLAPAVAVGGWTAMRSQRPTLLAAAAAVTGWGVLAFLRDPAVAILVFLAIWLPCWFDDSTQAAGPDDRLGPLHAAGKHADRHAGRHRQQMELRRRAVVLTGGAVAFAGGYALLLLTIASLQTELEVWLDPWRAQIGTSPTVEAMFSIAQGGLGGTGPGTGSPADALLAMPSFAFAVLSEELGLLGAVVVLCGLLLVASVGLGCAERNNGARRELAGVVAMLWGVQVLLAAAGMARLLPMTTLSMPFVADAPTSLVGNGALIGLLIGLSARPASAVPKRVRRPGPARDDATVILPTTRPSPPTARDAAQADPDSETASA